MKLLPEHDPMAPPDPHRPSTDDAPDRGDAQPGRRRSLLWFRRQLRVHDQPLFELLDPTHDDVAAVWLLDPRDHLDSVGLVPRAGVHRLRFLFESVEALRSSLADLGVRLIVRVGRPEEAIPDLRRDLAVDRVCFVEEPGTEERAIERALRRRIGEAAVSLPPETLFRIDDPRATARDLPEIFSSFRRSAERDLDIPPPRPAPRSLRAMEMPAGFDVGSVPDLRSCGLEEVSRDPRSVMAFRGGEPAGLERLRAWMFDRDRLKDYKRTRNGMLGEDYSSKFSPWLAVGALSPRFVAAETLRYETERVANDSTYWLRFELFWREYFRLSLLKHGRSFFRAAGPADSPLAWRHDDHRFEAWRSGTTGVPLVDANMRELEASGYMSNRGRQIVASFLTKNLDVDWRCGAWWFEHALVDYCPAANWGNWAYAAGVGADPRGFRGFDIARQARRYDPDGAYVTHWLPELGRFDRARRHAPWLGGGPRPIVDPRRSLDAARQRWETAHAHHRHGHAWNG